MESGTHLCRRTGGVRADMSLDLFDLKNESGSNVPLAARMRPLDFDRFIGQESLLAPGKPLRRDIEQGNVRSMILWGPPGCGKTTLARIIAPPLRGRF